MLKKALLWLPNQLLAATEGLEKTIRRLGRNKTVETRVGNVDQQANRILRNVQRPFTEAWKRGATRLDRLRLAIRNNPVFVRSKKLTFWVWYPFYSFTKFITAFFQTRSRLAFIGSVAAILLVGLGVFIAWRMQTQRRSLVLTYRLAVEDAISRNDFELAEVYQTKLQTLGVGSGLAEMRQIQDLVDRGNLAEAIRLAERLAPRTELGLVNAHLWLIQQYLKDQAEVKGAEALPIAQQHLDLVKESWRATNYSPTAKPPAMLTYLESLIEVKRKNIDRALALLREIENFWQAVTLQLELYARSNQFPQALEAAKKLVLMAKQDPQVVKTLAPALFTIWYGVLQRARASEELESVVGWWLQREPENPAVIALHAGFQMQEIDKLIKLGRKSDITSAAERLIETVVKLAPEQVRRVPEWYQAGIASAEHGTSFREVGDAVKQREGLPSILWEMLATGAKQSGDTIEAMRMIKLATEQDPNNANAWNLLARLALEIESPEQLELARDAAEKAVALLPQEIRFLETRGSISLKLSSWEAAIEDLKKVVASQPNSKAVHQGLGLAYRKIGREDLATLHESLGR